MFDARRKEERERERERGGYGAGGTQHDQRISVSVRDWLTTTGELKKRNKIK